MGRDEVLEHDLRYDRADEFMEVVLGHWDAWEDDAIVQDKASGLFAEPDKVHRLDYEGRYLPLARAVHRAALAAGPSGRHPGRPERPRQALRRAMGRGDLRRLSEYRGRQERATRISRPTWRGCGRDPEHVRSRTWSTPSPPRPRPRPRTNGRRSKSCRSKSTRCRCCPRRSTSISRAKGMDEAFTDAELAGMSGLQGIRDRV